VTGWRRSTHCAAGDCLEVKAGTLGDIIHLRRIVRDRIVWDSMVMSRTEWDTFVAGVKAGEFDDLNKVAP
jgi:hypothetical protein